MAGTTRSDDVGQIALTTISRLAFGVRYEPQYALTDKLGSLIDTILRAEGTPFGPETFPLSQAGPGDHALLNPNDDKVLHITHQNTILQWPIDTRNINRIKDIGSDFQEFVVKQLRKIGQVRGLVRYGVLLHLDNIDASSLRNRPINRYLSAEFSNANSLSMRFSRRLPSNEALVKKRVEDYRNVIYTLVETEEGKVNISIDYQEYFKPPLDAGEWDDKPFLKFVYRGVGYFQGEFRKWYEKLVGLPEVA